MDRRQKEKGNTCVRNDKKRRGKQRDNRWTKVSAKGHKEGTHAC